MPLANDSQPRSDTFTPALRDAMAEYEAARIHYREVVLASLDGRADGAAIRAAIAAARAAYAALERCRSGPASRPGSPPTAPAGRGWLPWTARRGTIS